MSTSLPEAVARALARQATVVTANQRSARALQIAYEQEQIRAGRTVWQPPRILNWDAWTNGLWQQLILRGQEDRLLLSSAQERLVWQEILYTDKHLHTLRQPAALAPLAQQAWGLLAAYAGLNRPGPPGAGADTEHFERWAKEFVRRCSRGKWLSAAQLELALAHAADAGKLSYVCAEIMLTGFDRMTPAQQLLCESLRNAGISYTELVLPPPPPAAPGPLEIASQSLVEATTADDEIQASACWAKKFLGQAPTGKIAVILPDVAAQRYRIDRIFRQTFLPAASAAEATAAGLPYEFTLGTSLRNVPLVNVAMTFLQWLKTPLPLETVSSLLLSSYFGNTATDLPARALFDAYDLRNSPLLRPELSLPWVLKRMVAVPALAGLRKQWSAAYALAQQHCGDGQLKTFREWSGLIPRILLAAGWTEFSSLSSTEYQQLEKWHERLRALSQLDFSGTRVTFSAAVEQLEQTVRETLFAPQSHNAPIQIMGVLESSGSVYDAVWFAGVTAESWPMKGNLQPLLSWHLQHSLKMPHSDPAVDTEHAATVTRRICASTPYILFSYCKMLDEVETEPSTLILPFVQASHVQAKDLIAITESQDNNFSLEEFEPVGTVPPVPDRVLSGGTGILKLQSLCPFRAFAEKRLASVGLKSMETGLNAIERGNLIHRVLEDFWKEVKTQEVLLRMDSPTTADTLDQKINHAFAQWTQTAEPWEQAYLNIRKKWLLRLLLQWLAIEKERPTFTVLESEETQKDAQIGPLHIRIRPDRIDNVADGEVILDYKTGLCSLTAWQGQRPDEPQLLLYATQRNPNTLRGIAFAQIRAGGMKLLEQPADANKVDEWRTVLEELAVEFHQGVADVAPKHFPKTCEHCEQQPFCRVAEINLASTEDTSYDNSD